MDPGSQRKERLQPPGYTNGVSDLILSDQTLLTSGILLHRK